MTIIQSIVMGIIEGLSEFLPVSSTGHLILAQNLMKISQNEFMKTFEISIQLGAISAVVFVYFRRLIVNLELYKKLFFAFLPTGVAGFFLYGIIKEYLFDAYVVSVSLVLGGIILLFADKLGKKLEKPVQKSEEISIRGALLVGVFQCISMIPGVSRAAATIIGGVYAGFERKAAVEFSFLLAVPTMIVATGYDLYKTQGQFSADEWKLLLFGGCVAFVFALLVVKTFIPLIARYGFRPFGIYRIALGLLFFFFSILGYLNIPAE